MELRARTKTTPPKPKKQSGQRSRELSALYFERILPEWRNPKWASSEFWRAAVLNEPIAIICRETLIANVLSFDWKIEPRDSTKRDELKDEIDYYTRFFEDTGEYSYSQITEWVGTDLLDLPFGSGVEKGYLRDDPNERLIWIELLDGGTLFPTGNRKWPVGQALYENPLDQVFFPQHAISRVYMSPRTRIREEGWGMAPPEKIFLSIELLRRGDAYYANLLLDTPEVGILDLMDMEKESAESWIKSWKDLLHGIDSFKIPVLYEHTTKAEFIPFKRSPTEILFDKTTLRYAAICCAGYGLSLSDIGIQAVTRSGETLAGSIRQERKSKRTGINRTKRSFEQFWNSLLPKYLKFKFIDLDDEVSVALGRARLANATAFSQYVAMGIFTPEEARQQTIADGLISISVPETLTEEQKMELAKIQAQRQPERPSMLGKPVQPSAGGRGEMKSMATQKDVINTSLKSMLDPDNIYLKMVLPLTEKKLELSSEGIVEDHAYEILDQMWSDVFGDKELRSLVEYNLQSIGEEIFDFIDWCEFPIAQIKQEWKEIFRSVVLDNNTVLETKFLDNLEQLLLNSENLIRDKLSQLIISYKLYALSGIDDLSIKSQLKLLYNWSAKHIADSIAKILENLLEGD